MVGFLCKERGFIAFLCLQISSVCGLVAFRMKHASEGSSSDTLSLRVEGQQKAPRYQQLPSTSSTTVSHGRREFLGSYMVAGLSPFLAPHSSEAAYVLDDETGDFVQVEDVDWQTAWKQRIDKASSMSQEEIFQAARGAGNVSLKDGEESAASKKRRALSGCRSADVRKTARAGNERECTARVLNGDVQFILEAL